MKTITIECINQTPVDQQQTPVTIGIPFPQGAINDTSQLVLHDSHQKTVLLQTSPLNYWPDKTPKWVLCDFIGDVPASGQAQYSLEYTDNKAASVGCVVEHNDDVWTVDTGKVCFSLDTTILRPFNSVRLTSSHENLVSDSEMVLHGADGVKWQSAVEQITLETTGPVRTTIQLVGRFSTSAQRQLKFEAKLHFYYSSAKVKLELRLHNPEAASHPGNLWDLGDPASILLKEWSLQLSLNQVSACRLQTDVSGRWHEFPQTDGSIYQESSGGQNWDSPVHRDRFGNVPMSRSGWILKAGEETETGERAQPTLLLETENCRIAAAIDSFWQRFPKKLACQSDTVEFGLLPGRFPADHELQGGEQITEVIYLDFNADNFSTLAASGLQVRCKPSVYTEAQVFGEGVWKPTDKKYKQLLAIALSDDKGFKAKREQVDEYGWRNFGELYADHESSFYKGDKPFVSHYNNQYDPLYSFYRLYLTGDSTQWGELADDLASHIADIDINHTDNDREEYCHGPFWHTDHYLDAGLSTHRMASREHLEHKNPAFCGGGPGAEHCYSGGLTLTYLLTGNPRYKQLVLDLADWCWISLHGPQTIGAALLRSVKNFKSLLRIRGSLWPRYPFTRGTGNCLNAELDAFELTGDNNFLLRATQLIQGTVQSTDIPDERNLLDAESNWSYTVFLAALCRYLQVKKSLNILDSDFHHAKASLLIYARWMVEHEYPYLEKPEILEYPNETWSAQDLRKGVILYHAAKYVDEEEREIFLNKAAFFLNSGLTDLFQQKTGGYTRPLVLMMQNSWAVEVIKNAPEESMGTTASFAEDSITPRLTLRECIKRNLFDLIHVVPATNLRREWNWLSSRIGKK